MIQAVGRPRSPLRDDSRGPVGWAAAARAPPSEHFGRLPRRAGSARWPTALPVQHWTPEQWQQHLGDEGKVAGEGRGSGGL